MIENHNPVTNVLHLEADQESTAYMIDMQGRRVLSRKRGSLLLFDLEDLGNGLCLLIVPSNGKVITRKILREN